MYFNTSILIRAVNPRERGYRESVRFINELVDRGFVFVISSAHWRESYRNETWRKLRKLFRRFNFVYCGVDADSIVGVAVLYVRRFGYSDERIIDVMHLMAARRCRCRFIAAVDGFIKAHAGEFGLIYINYYTGIP